MADLTRCCSWRWDFPEEVFVSRKDEVVAREVGWRSEIEGKQSLTS